MDKDNGGGNSPPVREVGDSPHITRLLAEKSDKPLFLSSWSSPEKFARRFLDTPKEDIWYRGSVWEDANESFSGVNSIEEAIDLAFNGWKEGGEIIERTRGYIQALNPLSNRLVKFGIAGASPDVPRAIAGEILNMRVPDPMKSQKRKTITIVFNMCEHGGNDKDAISNKAAVMAALIDEIEAKGFACEVISTACTDYGIRAVTSVCVKESHSPVDINRLAFGLGHSAMFRVLFFADWQSNRFCEKLSYGLGRVSTTLPTKQQNEQNIYTVTSGGSSFPWQKKKSKLINLANFETLEIAVTVGLNSIVNELQRQGCPAFPKLEKGHEDDLENEEPDEQDELPEMDDDF